MPTATELRTQAERLRARAERQMEAADEADERAARLDTLGEEPPAGSILRWNYRFQTGHCTVYEYAALRCNVGGSKARWYTTGPRGGEVPRTWSDLVAWITDGLVGDLVVILPDAPTPRLDGEVRLVRVLVTQ